MYQVQYEPLETFEDQIFTDSVNISNTTMTNLTDLQEYVEYNITVRAYTSVGPGPYSLPITERTDEDGKKEFFKSKILTIYCFLNSSNRATTECCSHCSIIY